MSVLPETYAYGVGSGSWFCFAGPLEGKSGGVLYERAANAVEVMLTGDLVGALQCVTNPHQPPPSVVTSFDISCVGAGGS